MLSRQFTEELRGELESAKDIFVEQYSLDLPANGGELNRAYISLFSAFENLHQALKNYDRAIIRERSFDTTTEAIQTTV